jgi:chemotaxis protein histidine kinase CheA
VSKPPASPALADTSAAVPDNAPVITVKGVCAPQPKAPVTKGATTKPATKTPAADCKTVITKAEFELLLKGLPNGNMQKRNIAGAWPKLVAMSSTAHKRGLDKKPEFGMAMEFVKMQILAYFLQQKITEDATQVSDQDIASYYKKNPEAFEQFTLERLFVPRTKQVEPAAKAEEKKEEKLTEEQQKAKQAEEKAKQEENEQAMSKLAESLQARAAAGEELATLQKEAYDAAGTKIESPKVSMPPMRRTGLSPAQASVFELKAGEVSPVINDAGGHYIYKVDSKELLPLDKVKEEIRRTLQTQQQRDMMDKINNSFTVEKNEAYFGPEAPGPGMPFRPGPGAPPMRNVPNRAPGGQAPTASQPAAPPSAVPPAAQPQTPPPAQTQPPAQPPATKPN